MPYTALTLDVADGLARVVLNRPQAGNPFNGPLCNEWLALANELASRTDVRAILLRAEGKHFSVGGDITEFSRRSSELPLVIREWTAALHAGLAVMARQNAPIVAAVHGSAMGAGLAVAAGCDIVCAARGAMFGAAYTGIGFSCDAGTSFVLAARMGVARARRFVLLAEKLSAEAALQVGLVDAVFDDAQLAAEAESMARRLSQGPTLAYGEIRRLFLKVSSSGFDAQLHDETQALARVAASTDAALGVAAFLERVPPRFKGA